MYPTAFLGRIGPTYAALSPLAQFKGLNTVLNPVVSQQDGSFSVGGHDIYAEFDQILHQIRRWLDGIYIVPTAKGKFVVAKWLI